jgi:uncharacterized tellurite resistance protein B-like protein
MASFSSAQQGRYMFNSIKSFFENRLSQPEQEQQDRINKVDLACAALLVEVMNSDQQLDQRESQEILAVLQSSLHISEQDLQEIVNLAKSEAADATSLYEFTRLINDSYDYQQKCLLIENMWRIAFSDEELDKYEDHLIRRVSDLIYISHSDFIRTKLAVKNNESS